MKIIPKITIVCALLLSLNAYGKANMADAKLDDEVDTLAKPHAACLDGFQYWAIGGNLAVRIDPETLEPKRCLSK